MQYLYAIPIAALTLLLSACTAMPTEQMCPAGTQKLPGCPPINAVADPVVDKLYKERTWYPKGETTIDSVKVGEETQIPINHALTKVTGPSHDDAMNSLAAKIWLIENAEHTIDLTYYIFKRDLVGYSILGALCNAVERGVDVRIMVDSLGSYDATHDELRALESCADDAGFMRNAAGQITTKKARVQAVIFNAITNFNFNRRSHDKLLVIDGHYPDKAAVVTGGRNISLDYYGITADGSEDPNAFRDLELILKPSVGTTDGALTVGDVSEYYYSLLFLYDGNRRLRPIRRERTDDIFLPRDPYKGRRDRAQRMLAFLKSLPEISKRLANMPHYMSVGFHDAQVRLAHQLNNLTSQEVTTNVEENLRSNPNSINYFIAKSAQSLLAEANVSGTLRVVSPYLFSGQYFDKDGNLIYDGAKTLHNLLRDHPDLRIEIVTNSVMTSDNPFAQAIIDMDMAPRLLLTPELSKAWLSGLAEGEFNPQVVQSEEWKTLVNNPQIFIYETGKLDSVQLGGGQNYGKLHAKFIISERGGFIGTSNFDYRSNLYNNEMGFFFENSGLRQDVIDIFDSLKATAYRWGSPEWLQMRKELMASDSKKAGPARNQRVIFKGMKGLGIEYMM